MSAATFPLSTTATATATAAAMSDEHHHQQIQQQSQQQQQPEQKPSKKTFLVNSRDNSDYKWQRARGVVGALEVVSVPVFKYKDDMTPRYVPGREAVFQDGYLLDAHYLGQVRPSKLAIAFLVKLRLFGE